MLSKSQHSYSYSSTSTRTWTRTHVIIKYSYLYLYSHILQVLACVLVFVNLVLAPAMIYRYQCIIWNCKSPLSYNLPDVINIMVDTMLTKSVRNQQDCIIQISRHVFVYPRNVSAYPIDINEYFFHNILQYIMQQFNINSIWRVLLTFYRLMPCMWAVVVSSEVIVFSETILHNKNREYHQSRIKRVVEWNKTE